jgi:hypothetical protein
MENGVLMLCVIYYVGVALPVIRVIVAYAQPANLAYQFGFQVQCPHHLLLIVSSRQICVLCTL